MNILIGIVRNKIIALLLGPIGVGFISIYNTASVFLQNSTNFGLQMSGVRDVSRAFDSGNADALQENQNTAFVEPDRWWNRIHCYRNALQSAKRMGFFKR